MLFLKQSTAATIKIGPFLDSTDGNTAETSLTLSQADIRLSKNGANIAQKNESSSASHDELGYYDCDLDTTDTGTLGRLQLFVHESGALAVWHEFMVVPANVYDSLVGGSDMLEVDVQAVDGDETAAANLELDYDGTGYAKANSTVGTVTTLTGHTAQTGDNFARLGAPAGASIAADIAAVEDQTDDIGAAGAGLTAVPWNAAWDAEVQSEVQDAIEANHLDHLLATTYDPAGKPGAADALLNEIIENDGGVSRFTENALEQAPSGTGASAASIADAVLDEALAGHTGAGSLGKAIADIESDATAILADSNELQANQGNWLTATDVDLNADQSGVTIGTVTDVTNQVDANMQAISGDSDAADKMESLFDRYPTGTAQSGSASTIVLQAGSSSVDADYDGAIILITGGTGAGQWRMIRYYWGASLEAYVSENWGTNPDATSTYILLPALALSNVYAIRSDAAAATNFLFDYNGTGYDKSNSTIGNATTVPWQAAWDAEVQSEVTDALETTLSDSVPADGSLPSLKQAVYMIVQFLTERSVSSTTLTVKKVDGSTSLMTFTLDDGTSPTSITRAT